MESAHGSGHRSFACHTPADPGRIWAALTDPAKTAVYLYGLALNSTWVAHATIVARHSDRPALIGRVLCSRPHERLSYLLQAQPDDPPVYLTWLIGPNDNGCIIRLQIDEVEFADDTHDAEDTWLPVLARLQALLGLS
jgi:uncharacterized protein YndB with AHSA1/START domain